MRQALSDAVVVAGVAVDVKPGTVRRGLGGRAREREQAPVRPAARLIQSSAVIDRHKHLREPMQGG